MNYSITFASENSADSDMGRRPKLKSDEFSDANVIVYEIISCEDFFTAEKVLHFFGALPPLSGSQCARALSLSPTAAAP